MGWGKTPPFSVPAPSVSLQPVRVARGRMNRMTENKTQRHTRPLKSQFWEQGQSSPHTPPWGRQVYPSPQCMPQFLLHPGLSLPPAPQISFVWHRIQLPEKSCWKPITWGFGLRLPARSLVSSLRQAPYIPQRPTSLHKPCMFNPSSPFLSLVLHFKLF